MNVQPNILSVIQRVLLSVGVDASDQNLLQGAPFYNAWPKMGIPG